MIYTLASILRFIFRTTLFVLFLVLLLFPILLLINHYQRRNTELGWKKAGTVSSTLAIWLLWFFGVRVRTTGTLAQGPVLITANHISWLDILALHSGGAMGFVAKAEIEQWPVFCFIARTGETIFHQRGSHDSASDVISLMVRRLEEGRRVAIFPEGGILPGAEVRVFHARMFRAAIDAGCPVQPAMVRYLRNGRRDDGILFRKDESMLENFARLLARPGALADVHYLPPMSSTGKPRRALADAARAAVISRYESDS